MQKFFRILPNMNNQSNSLLKKPDTHQSTPFKTYINSEANLTINLGHNRSSANKSRTQLQHKIDIEMKAE
jgi:hypothetical protein